jgi:hypothetical protein
MTLTDAVISSQVARSEDEKPLEAGWTPSISTVWSFR